MRVLEGGEHLVAHPFVERHAAVERVLLVDHARTEDGVGVLFDERLEEDGQLFRRVLAVAVDEGDDVEALLDGVAVAELLVAAVALVHRIAQDGDLEIAEAVLALEAGAKGLRPWRNRR